MNEKTSTDGVLPEGAPETPPSPTADRAPQQLGVPAPTQVDSATLPPPPIKVPSDAAFRSWVLVTLLGYKQEQAAVCLSGELRRTISQGQVSRWARDVREYLEQGGLLPAQFNPVGASKASKAIPVDPGTIDMARTRIVDPNT